MKAQALATTIKALYPKARTLCIEGAPGGGKTTLVHQCAKALGVPCIELHMPTMLVEDFGIPMPKDGVLKYTIPDWFPAQGKPGTEGGGILLFDDRNQANADLQKVLANICQARNLHGVPLADGWMVISTGNRQSDRAGANRVLSHLRNRETVIQFETNTDDWCKWALANGVKVEVVSFIRFRPGLLHDFDPQKECNPTPRSWTEGVSEVLGLVPSEAEYECFSGAVGEGAAAEFVGFMRIFRELPNPDDILMNPMTAPVPTDPATLYALAGALSNRVTETSMDRLISYTKRLPPEFSVLTVSYAVRLKPELSSTPAFTVWCVDNQDVLF